MATISVIASVPLLFQSIGIILCNKNQYISTTANLCYSMAQDQINPTKVDMQMLDMKQVEYIKTWWVDMDTMETQDTTKDGCIQWKNQNYNQTSTCQ